MSEIDIIWERRYDCFTFQEGQKGGLITDKTLVIYDKDGLYCERLMEYINRKTEVGLCAVAFTEEEAVKTYLRRNHTELLLCEEQIADDPELVELCRNIRYLSAVRPPDCRKNAVSRYQSAETVIRFLNREEAGIQDVKKTAQPARLLGITCISEDGRASQYAWDQARILARKQRVLLLCLSSLFRPPGGKVKVNGMSELIYRLKQAVEIRTDDIVETIQGVDCIYGYSFWTDTEELGEPEARRLLVYFQEKGEYDSIVLDLSGQHRATVVLLNACDQIEMISESTETERYMEYKRQLQFAGFSGLEERFIGVSQSLIQS